MANINYYIDKNWQEGNNAIMKTDRQVRIKPGRLKFKTFVREQYLRSDIPCQSALCTEDCKNHDKNALLSSTVTHYLVPCSDVIGHYIEIIEYSCLIGILFMQTVINKCLHEFGKRHYNKICTKIRDKSNQSIFFPNEFSFFTFCHRKSGESCEDWQIRNIYSATVWYYNHLSGNMPIVIVTENQEIIHEYQNQTSGIFVVSLGEYLTTFWPQLTTIHELYFSLKASLTTSNTTSSENKDYDDHLSQELLLAGVTNGQFHVGKINVNKYHAQLEALVSPSSSESKHFFSDILIVGMKHRNRAIHGDVVFVELLPKSEWKGRIQMLSSNSETEQGECDKSGEKLPTGKVVGIKQRRWRDYVATFPVVNGNANQPSPGEGILVIPYDYRIPKIRIVTRQFESLCTQRIVVRIDSWNLGSQYPNGHFVQSLGPIGDPQTETSVLLVENGITTSSFPSGLLLEMPPASWTPPNTEIESRRDLRSTHLVFSIDPKGCEDVDDAVTIKKLKNGHWQLGVHIADVTYFVPPDSLTDFEARNRGTTVYLTDRRFDMLPPVLNSNVCSLLRNVDRFAVSVFWELNASFEVRGVEFARTVINSSYQLTYEAAEDIVKSPKFVDLTEVIPEFENIRDKEKKYSELRKCILKLTEIGRNLKWRRGQKGALELESVEVQVTFKEQTNKQQLEDIKPKQHLEAHETVAELMIFANQWVAKKIYDNFPHQALLRRHPVPQMENFKDLKSCAEVKGFEIDTKSNKSLAESLDRCVDLKDPLVNNLLRQLATHAMSSAEYFSPGSTSNPSMSHYGLGLDFYTHFTSPIRRYADVLVHRLLMASIELNQETSHLLSGEDLEDVCQHINMKHKASQDVQKSSQLFFQVLYFDNQDDTDRAIVDGVIFSIRSNGFLVYIHRYGIKGPVYLRNKENQVAFVVNGNAQWTEGSLSQQPSSLLVTSNFGSQEYKLFDHVTVKIEVVHSHAHANSIKLELIDNNKLMRDLESEEIELSRKLFNHENWISPRASTSNMEINNSPDTPDKLNTSLLYKVLLNLRELSLSVSYDEEKCKES